MAKHNPLTAKQLNQRVQRHPDGTKEYWRDVVGWEGYYRISDRGRAKSLARWVRRGNNGMFLMPGRILKPGLSNGYETVFLCSPNRRKNGKSIHEMVLESFVGPKPIKHGTSRFECRHLNGIPTDNNLSNLKWGTCKQNHQDAVRHGTCPKGVCHWNSKLSEDDVRSIRSKWGRYRGSLSLKKWAKQEAMKCDVLGDTLEQIVRRSRWKHII